MEMVCKTCRFWRHEFKDSANTNRWLNGECHRRSPAADTTDRRDPLRESAARVFPITNAEDGCGDYSEQPIEPRAQ